MNPARCLFRCVPAALLLAGASLMPAAAAPVCMDSQEMEAALIDWYLAEPVPGAKATDEQIWQSQETGVWALVRYRADGQACVVDQGQLALAARQGERGRPGAS